MSTVKLVTYDTSKNKSICAGTFDIDTATFTKVVKSYHFMVKENGYGIQEDIIKQLISSNCYTIIISAPGYIYKSYFNNWLLKGKVRNYGHGSQRFLSIKEMEILPK